LRHVPRAVLGYQSDRPGIFHIVGDGEKRKPVARAASGKRIARKEMCAGLHSVAFGRLAYSIDDSLTTPARYIVKGREDLQRWGDQSYRQLDLHRGWGGRPEQYAGAIRSDPDNRSAGLKVSDRVLSHVHAHFVGWDSLTPRCPGGSGFVIFLCQRPNQIALNELDFDSRQAAPGFRDAHSDWRLLANHLSRGLNDDSGGWADAEDDEGNQAEDDNNGRE
jgi:hypothetical protein